MVQGCYCRWNSDLTCHLLQHDNDDTNTVLIQSWLYRLSAGHQQSSELLKYDESKVNYCYCRVAQTEQSVAYHHKVRIAKMCRLCDFVIAVFGWFSQWSLVPCSYRSVGVTSTCFVEGLGMRLQPDHDSGTTSWGRHQSSSIFPQKHLTLHCKNTWVTLTIF